MWLFVQKMRSAVFSVDEQLRLLDLIEQEKHVIENKATNKTANEEKDSAWNRVSQAYNAVATQYRTVDQLKSKFDNLKTKARKAIVENRIQKFDPTVKAVLKIIGVKSVSGLENAVDCDYEDTRASMDQGSIKSEIDVMKSEISEAISPERPEELPNSTFSSLHFNTLSETGDDEHIIEKDVDHEGATKRPRDECEEKDSDNRVPKRSKFSCGHKRLKQTNTKKVRPAIPNPLIAAKAEYYRKKATEAETETWWKKQQSRRQREEHEKKMKLLDIEIKLKEEELRLKYIGRL